MFLPGTFWHLTHEGSLLLHNAVLGQGAVASASMTAMTISGVGTQYGLIRQSDPKEQAWEAVRATEFQNLPSRLNTLFLFDDMESAKAAAARWFGREKRCLLETRIVEGSIWHRADVSWLDSNEEWEGRARSYWRGEMSDTPAPEIIVHGAVFFPGWDKPPFKLLRSS
jgi:hypothetical protein